MKNQQLALHEVNNGVIMYSDEVIKSFQTKLQTLVDRLNSNPNANEVDKTPDGKALSIPISFIEMNLDELFFGLWETENFKWSVISNEVVGSIDLIITHPITLQKYKRVGAAGIIIQVDKGANALDVSAKKANALDMGFPKLKAECLKNAAQSFGKIFGRDLNRKKADVYNPILPVSIDELTQLFELKKDKIDSGSLENVERVINNKETRSYNKLYKYLTEL